MNTEDIALLQRIRKEIEIKDRVWRFQKFRECFVASELVTWMVENNIAANREAAVLRARRLAKAGAFEHVTKTQDFKDEELFFSFPKRKKNTQNSGSDEKAPRNPPTRLRALSRSQNSRDLTPESIPITVRFRLGGKSNNVITKIHADPEDYMQDLLSIVIPLVKKKKLLSDMSTFDENRFGFTLPNSNKFIDDDTPVRRVLATSEPEFWMKQRPTDEELEFIEMFEDYEDEFIEETYNVKEVIDKLTEHMYNNRLKYEDLSDAEDNDLITGEDWGSLDKIRSVSTETKVDVEAKDEFEPERWQKMLDKMVTTLLYVRDTADGDVKRLVESTKEAEDNYGEQMVEFHETLELLKEKTKSLYSRMDTVCGRTGNLTRQIENLSQLKDLNDESRTLIGYFMEFNNSQVPEFFSSCIRDDNIAEEGDTDDDDEDSDSKDNTFTTTTTTTTTTTSSALSTLPFLAIHEEGSKAYDLEKLLEAARLIRRLETIPERDEIKKAAFLIGDTSGKLWEELLKVFKTAKKEGEDDPHPSQIKIMRKAVVSMLTFSGRHKEMDLLDLTALDGCWKKTEKRKKLKIFEKRLNKFYEQVKSVFQKECKLVMEVFPDTHRIRIIKDIGEEIFNLKINTFLNDAVKNWYPKKTGQEYLEVLAFSFTRTEKLEKELTSILSNILKNISDIPDLNQFFEGWSTGDLGAHNQGRKDMFFRDGRAKYLGEELSVLREGLKREIEIEQMKVETMEMPEVKTSRPTAFTVALAGKSIEIAGQSHFARRNTHSEWNGKAWAKDKLKELSARGMIDTTKESIERCNKISERIKLDENIAELFICLLDYYIDKYLDPILHEAGQFLPDQDPRIEPNMQFLYIVDEIRANICILETHFQDDVAKLLVSKRCINKMEEKIGSLERIIVKFLQLCIDSYVKWVQKLLEKQNKAWFHNKGDGRAVQDLSQIISDPSCTSAHDQWPLTRLKHAFDCVPEGYQMQHPLDKRNAKTLRHWFKKHAANIPQDQLSSMLMMMDTDCSVECDETCKYLEKNFEVIFSTLHGKNLDVFLTAMALKFHKELLTTLLHKNENKVTELVAHVIKRDLVQYQKKYKMLKY